MKTFSMKPYEAFNELLEVVKGEAPVHAVFRMPTSLSTIMTVLVDGEPLPASFTINKDGTWEATWRTETPEHLK